MTRCLIVDDDLDLRDTLVDVLVTLGSEAVAAGSLAEVEALGDEALTVDLAVLDVNLGPGRPNGLEVAHWLTEHGFAGRVLFLTGHAAAHPLVLRATHEEHARVVEKPMPMEALESIAHGVVP